MLARRRSTMSLAANCQAKHGERRGHHAKLLRNEGAEIARESISAINLILRF
jgi:hypothetical protein